MVAREPVEKARILVPVDGGYTRLRGGRGDGAVGTAGRQAAAHIHRVAVDVGHTGDDVDEFGTQGLGVDLTLRRHRDHVDPRLRCAVWSGADVAERACLVARHRHHRMVDAADGQSVRLDNRQHRFDQKWHVVVDDDDLGSRRSRAHVDQALPC